MLLYRCVLPEDDKMVRDLYYRTSDGSRTHEGVLRLEPGAKARFDTYFNGFFYSKYVKYTIAERLTVKVRSSGGLIAELVCAEPDLTETILDRLEIHAPEATFQPVLLHFLPENGMLFCKFTAIDESVIWEIRYEAEVKDPAPVRMAVVICTYHREEYVQKNLRHIHGSIWNGSAPIADELDVLVIDNGGTLEPCESEHVRVIPNRNLGGSGGFARGMLEALACGDQYTHVLLMDDDISFEPEVLVRTVQFLKIRKETGRPLCIGGQMLMEDAPTVQYEAGGRFEKGRLWSNGRGVDLSMPEALLTNEKERSTQYNAWWYCCISLELIRSRDLPLPLFIKGDDVEYGLRLGADFLLTNGIGVWHKSFAQKQSPHLEYYIKRNELIVSAIHQVGDGVVSGLYKLFRALGGSILRNETGQVRYLRRAYVDFLKGPDFLLRTDAEELNRTLMRFRNARPPRRATTVFVSAGILLEMLIRFLFRYGKVRDEYRSRQRELTSECFWRQRLGLQMTEERHGQAI